MSNKILTKNGNILINDEKILTVSSDASSKLVAGSGIKIEDDVISTTRDLYSLASKNEIPTKLSQLEKDIEIGVPENVVCYTEWGGIETAGVDVGEKTIISDGMIFTDTIVSSKLIKDGEAVSVGFNPDNAFYINMNGGEDNYVGLTTELMHNIYGYEDAMHKLHIPDTGISGDESFASYDWHLPNKSGTIALLDDIGGSGFAYVTISTDPSTTLEDVYNAIEAATGSGSTACILKASGYTEFLGIVSFTYKGAYDTAITDLKTLKQWSGMMDKTTTLNSLVSSVNANTTYYRKGVDDVVTVKDNIVDLGDVTIRGLQSLKINSDEDDELNSPITDDVDATYLAKGIRLENCDSGNDYELYFPAKSGTFALLDDITGGTSLETVSVTGSGNALTTASLSTDKKTLTLDKGNTFLPLSGGTMTGRLTNASGITVGVGNGNGINLGKWDGNANTKDDQIGRIGVFKKDSDFDTIFGHFASYLNIGHGDFALRLRGSNARPTYYSAVDATNKDIALAGVATSAASGNTGASGQLTTDSSSGTTGAASGNTANSTAFNTGAASGSTANSSAFDTGAGGTGNTGASGTGNTGTPSATTTVNNYTMTYSSGTLTITSGTATVASNTHTHTGPSHTHTGPSHTHSVGAHSHGLNSHTHSVGAHSHGLNSHTHSGPSHTHTIATHSHSLNSHTHTQQ